MTLEQLEAQRAARLDPADLPNGTTMREAATYAAETARQDFRIRTAKEARETLDGLVGAEEFDIDWRTKLAVWRQILVDEFETIKSPIRDKAIMGRNINLTLSIRFLDGRDGNPERAGERLKDSGYSLETLALGQLMIADGFVAQGADPAHNYLGKLPWFGSVKDVEKRIADVAATRARVQAALDDALLDDDVRAQRHAEATARIAALNQQPTRKTRNDGTQYDKYPDGRRVEVTR